MEARVLVLKIRGRDIRETRTVAFSVDGCFGRKTTRTKKRRKDRTDAKNIKGIAEPRTDVSPPTTLYLALFCWFTGHFVHPAL